MNVRETSTEAFRRIKQEGLLSEKREVVYELLFLYGPATAMELRRRLPAGYVDSQVRARLNELRELGVAKEVRERECMVTGMRVIEWDVTTNLPRTVKKTKHIRRSVWIVFDLFGEVSKASNDPIYGGIRFVESKDP